MAHPRQPSFSTSADGASNLPPTTIVPLPGPTKPQPGYGQVVGATPLHTHLDLAVLCKVTWGILVARYAGTEQVAFGYIQGPGSPLGPEGMIKGLTQCVLHLASTTSLPSVLGDSWSTSNPPEGQRELNIPIESQGHLASVLVTNANREIEPLQGYTNGHRHEQEALETLAAATRAILLIYCHTMADRLAVHLVFRRTHVAEVGVQELSLQFLTVVGRLVQAAENPEMLTSTTIADVTGVDDTERRRLLHLAGSNVNSNEPNAPVSLQVNKWVRKAPDGIALEHEGRTVTYLELDRLASILAQVLVRDHGAKSEVRIALFLSKSIEFVVALFAVLKSGAAYVCIDPKDSEELIHYIVEDSAASLVLTTSLFQSRLIVPHTRPVLPIDNLLACVQIEACVSTLPAALPSQPSALAYVAYRSDTIGQPRGVLVEHGSLASAISDETFADHFGPGKRIMPITVVNYPWILWKALTRGGTVVLPGSDPVADLVSVQSLVTPLSFLKSLALADLPNLKFIAATDGMYPPTLLNANAESRQVAVLFGFAETSVVSHLAPVSLTRDLGFQGTNSTLSYVVDKDLRLLPVGVPGELLVGGSQVARGYHNFTELTARHFIHNPFGPGRIYRTGYCARWRPEGKLEILGRINKRVQVRDQYIQLEVIEGVCLQFPGVSNAISFVKDGQLVVYVSPSGVCLSDLKAQLVSSLPGALVPDIVIVLENLPLNSFGVVDQEALALSMNGPLSSPTDCPSTSNQARDAAERYWRERFSHIEDPTLLIEPHHPLARTPTSGDQGHFSTVEYTVDRADRFVSSAQVCGVTPLTLIHAALVITLHRYTGAKDIVFGVKGPSRCTGASQSQSSQARCIDLPRCINLTGEPTVGELLAQVQSSSSAALNHADYPSSDIYAWAGLQPDRSLFNVSISTADHLNHHDLLAGANDGSPMGIGLTVTASIAAGALHLLGAFWSTTFSPEFVTQFISHLAMSIQSVANGTADAPVHAVEIFSPEECTLLTDTWARNPRDLDSPLVPLGYQRQVCQRPDHVALRDGPTAYTYAQVGRMASYLGHQLCRVCTCGPDQVIGILADNSVALVVGQLAVWMTGSAFVVISPGFPVERQRFILEDAACGAVLSTKLFIDKAEAIGAVPLVVIDMSEPTDDDSLDPRPEVVIDPSSLAYIVYTSGSTGTPKGVMIEHGSLANYLAGFITVTEITPATAVPTTMDPTFDASLCDIWTTLYHGGTVLVCRNAYDRDLPSATRATFTPSLLASVDPHQLASLTSIIVGGESISSSLVDQWAGRLDLLNLYGPTELTIDTHFACLRPGKVVAIGHPLPNAVGLILDNHLRPVPIGVTGQLYLGGKGLARGYLKRPDLTTKAFITWPVTGERLYRSGDLARWLPDGQIECLGRMDNQVKVRGFRIELEEVRKALLALSGVQDAHVLVHERHLVAFVYPAGPPEATMVACLQRTLPSYMVPTYIFSLDLLPCTRNGKVDRHALLAHFLHSRRDELMRAELLPSGAELSGAQGVLASVLVEVLRLPTDRFPVQMSFVRLGGDSISAIQVVARCRALGFTIPVPDLLASRSLAEAALSMTPFNLPTPMAEPLQPSGSPFSMLKTSPRDWDRLVAGLPSLGLSLSDVADMYPMTPVQQGLWAATIRNPSEYLLQFAWTVTGITDADHLYQGLYSVVAGHTALRTVFLTTFSNEWCNGVQIVTKHPQFTWVGAENWADLNVGQENQFLASDQASGFTMGEPLLRCCTVRLTPSRFRFVLTVHHALVDGWSIGTLFRELVHRLQGASRDIPAPSPSFAEYVHFLAHLDHGQAQGVWHAYLAGVQQPTMLILPKDSVTGLCKTTHRFTLYPNTLDLQATVQSHDLTVYTLLKAAWAYLLHRYTDQRDIVFGNTVSGRTLPLSSIERLVGCLINTIPCRVQIDPHMGLNTLLQTISRQAQRLMPVEHCHLSDLARWVEGEVPVASMFNTLLVYENYPDAELETLGGSVQFSDVSVYESTEYGLTVIIEALHGRLDVSLNWCLSDYSRPYIEALGQQLQFILSQMVDALRPGSTGLLIDGLRLLVPADLETTTCTFERPLVELKSPGCAHDLFIQQVQIDPDTTAVEYDDPDTGLTAWTYQGLLDRANQVAHYLTAQGVQREEPVGLLMDRLPSAVAAMLGVHLAGAAFVPLDPNLPLDRLRFITSDCGIRRVLCNTNDEAKTKAVGEATGVTIDSLEDLLAGTTSQPATPNMPRIRPTDLSHILYTSGTTGQPKGVQLEHRVMANFVQQSREVIAVEGGMRVMQNMALTFDCCLFEVWVTLCNGATLVLRNDLLDTLPKVDVLMATPSVLATLDPTKYPNLCHVITAGEALPRPLAERWSAHCSVTNMYGPTECFVCHTMRYIPGGPVTIGRPVPNTECYILDRGLRPVPIGVPGEIYVGGVCVTRGYVNRPDLEAATLLPNPFTGQGYLYRTGDLGRWLLDGTVEYFARRDDQVKIRGHRVEPREIEAVLNQCVAVSSVAVVVSSGKLYAFVSPDTVVLSDLKAHALARLPPYMVPGAILPLSELPRNRNGKTDKRRLLEMLPALINHSPDRAVTAPKNEAQRLLVEVMATVLDLPPADVDIDDSFLQLGGDSISAIRLSSLCRDRGLQLSIAQVFQHGTPAALARIAAQNDPPSATMGYQPFDLLTAPEDGLAGLKDEVATGLGVGVEAIEDILPVSSLQQGFLVSTLKDPTAYMVQMAYDLTGPLDVARLSQSWSQVIRAHQILRTKFVVPTDQSRHAFLQVVLRDTDFEWTYQDQPRHDTAEVERDHFTSDRKRGFSLSGPLLRFTVYHGTGNRHLFCITFHHALLDAWSEGIVMAESLEHYHSVEVQRRTQYHDFLQHVSRIDQATMADFWRDYLDGVKLHSAVQFPISPGSEQPDHGEVRYTLSPSLSSVQSYCREIGLTVNALLRAVWALTLARYLSEHEEVTFGVLVSGRNVAVPGIEGMVGMCINTLPFRAHFPADGDLKSLLQGINAASGILTEYEQCSLVDIKRWSNLSAGTHLLNSLLVNDNYETTTAECAKSIDYTPRSGQNFTEYAYTVGFSHQNDALVLQISYQTRYCDPTYAHHLVNFIDHCLASLVSGRAGKVGDLMCLPPIEKSLVEQWSAGRTADFPQKGWLAYQFFTQHLTTRPDAIALESSTTQFTYTEVYCRVCAIAATLRNQGAQAGDRVALLFSRCPEFIFSYLAVLLLGCVCVPMDANNASDRLAYMVDILDNLWVIANSATLELVVELGVEDSRVVYADLVLASTNPDQTSNLPSQRSSDSSAYILFTSGTTGRPKGVQVTHRSLVNFVLAACERFQLPSNCRFLQTLSIAFDSLVQEVFCTFHTGGTLVIQDGELLEDLKRVNCCAMVPSLLAVIDPESYSNLQYIIIGGESLASTLAHQWSRTARIHNVYGPTEVTVACHSHLAALGSPTTVGTTLANVQCHILDDQLRPVPVGITGEIYIAGVGVSKGYWKQPELTEKVFLDNPFGVGRLYRTGDLGCWLANGEVQVLGRKDFQVKLRGFRIELGEIESTCLAFPGVSNAVALVKAERLVSYIRHSGDDVLAVKRHLASRLPHYMVPDHIIKLDMFPLTSVGKADRTALQALPLPAPSYIEFTDSVNNLPPTFEPLRRAVREALRLSSNLIVPSASFFQLGGDSISAIQLSSLLRKGGLHITVAQIFAAGSLVDLAIQMENRTDQPATETVVYQPYSLLGDDGVERDSLIQATLDAASVAAEDIQDIMPVFSLQVGFLVNTLKDPSSYMVQSVYEVRGALDVGRLHQSWQLVGRRHEILRSKFVVADSFSVRPFLQIIMKRPDIAWSYSVIDEGNPEEIEASYLTEDRRHGFTLDGPLLRLRLIRLKDTSHLMCFTFHHALLDAWSASIVLGEVLECYYGIKPQPRTQFHEFISCMARADQEKEAIFWQGYLAGIQVHPVLQFPVSPNQQTVKTETSRYTFSSSLNHAHDYCKKTGVTMNSLLRFLWALTLARYTGHRDEVTFGVLMSGRNLPVPGIEGMVGMCINTLPFRVHFLPDKPVVDVIGQINQDSGALIAHEQSGLVDIKRWANVSADTMLFNSLVIYDNYEEHQTTAGEGQLELIPRDGYNETEYAYTVHFSDSDGNLGLDIKYSTRHCGPEYARLLCQYMDHVLTRLTSDTVTHTKELMVLPAAECGLVDQWSAGHVIDFPQKDWLAHQLFTQNIATRPDAIALESATTTYTYAEVYQHACSVASELRRRGFQPGHMAALLFTRCPEFIFSYLAVLLLGGVCVPMDADNAPDRLQYMLSVLDDPWVITLTGHGKVAASLGVQRERFIYANALPTGLGNANGFSPDPSRQPGDLMYIMFTSGTTGQPKGVQVCHRALVNFTLAMSDRLRLTPATRLLSMASLAFDASLNAIFGSFHAGGTLILYDCELFDCLPRANAFHATPSLLAAIDARLYPNISLVMSGGEALSPLVATTWSQHARFVNLYGPTEVTVDSHAGEFRPDAPVSIGHTLANVQCYILDGDMRPVPIGVPGEIYIGGAGLALGYWKQPELTNSVFIANPYGPGRLYRTGDLGCWLPSGKVQHLGRRDHQVKLRGFRIELGEIETHCQTLPGVSHAVALVKDDILVAYVAPETIEAANLRRHLTIQLPDYMVPRHIIAVSSIPTTTVGKADRRKLLGLPLPMNDEGADELDSQDDAPAFAVLRSAVAQVLHISLSRAGPRASFFQLGGDSLSAIRLASTLRTRGYVATVAQIFQYPTLGDLGEALVPVNSNLPFNFPYVPFSLVGGASESDKLRLRLSEDLCVQPGTITDVLPVSSLQQGFLVSTLKDTSAYMVQESFEILGPLDPTRLRQSWFDTLNSHTILRTKFVVADEFSNHAFLQAVLAQADVEWTDQTSTEEDLQQVEASYFAEERARGFDFRGPLIRLALLRVHDQHHVLFFAFHHALLDAWSTSIIKNETLERYHGQPTQPRTQYPDYMAKVTAVSQVELSDFWATNLAGVKCHPVIQFPVQPVVNSPQHSAVNHTLSVSLSTIHGFCREQGLTFNSLLRAVWALTLARYLGEAEEVTFGVLMSGRNLSLPGIEGMVGMCLNVLPFRTRIQPDEPLDEYIRRVNQESGTLTEYEQCGLVDIRRWSRIDSDASLFQTLLVYDNHPDAKSEAVFDFQYQPRSGQNFTEYAYTIGLTEHSDALHLDLQYLDQFCDPHYARLMCQFIDHCMAAIVAKPASQTVEVMCLPRAEKLLVDQWSTGRTIDFPHKAWLAHQLFTQQLTTRPDEVALESSTAVFTYAQAYDRAVHIATALLSGGLLSSDPVALFFTRSTEFVVSYLAVLLAGGICVPVDASLPADRLNYMLDLLDWPTMVTTSSHATSVVPGLAATPRSVLCVDTLDVSQPADTSLLAGVSIQPTDVAYINFTSGSTGQPKGIPIRHESLVNVVLAWCDLAGFSGAFRCAQTINIMFDPSLLEIFGTFYVGGTLVVQDGELFDVLQRVNACVSVPSVLSALDPDDFPTLSHVSVIGEMLPYPLAQTWGQGRELYNIYGPTEITITSHGTQVQPGKLVTIGPTLPNYHCYILDDQLNPAPIGVPGEICIAGVGVSHGYWKRPDLTKKAFVSSPMSPGCLYRTGDLGCWLANGEVQVVGRKDFQIKLRGMRVELGEIESHCQTFPGVSNAVALVKEKRLVVYISPAPVSSMELSRHVASKLPRYMVPDLFLALEAMPLTSAGKTDRRTLQGMSLPENDNVDLSDNQPISETFAALRRALAETLDVDPARVVPSASFLRLGGDSISAIQFSSRCKRYGLKLTVADILKHPVLANLERCAEPMLDPVSPKYLMRPVGIVPHTAVVRQVIPDLRRVNHFNQSFLLKCRVPLSLLMLKQAVRALVAHHDILRIRLSTRNNEWEQEILELPDGIRDDFHLSRFALVTEANITLADYDDWVLRAQQAINIERGPVLVGSLLTVDAQPYVYFSVHHLCIDFVSWRILLEDLETLLQGQSLPTKTLSFREWATLVNGYAQTLPNDLWPNHGPVAELPIDSNPIPTEPITYHSVQSVSRSLGCEVSHALYGEAAPRVDTSPQEFMVASLVMALTTTFQLDSLEIQMEGHGRQPWSSDIDISRTLGWFTSIYPVAFHVKQAEHYSSLPQALRLLAHIKQRLRSVPDSGLPYGLLNDLKGRDPTLPTTPNPSVRPGGIIFNYTGRFEQLDALNAFWSPASLGDGWSHDLSLDELVRHALSVSCSYGAETGLSLHIQYSRLMYRERNVELLADRWLMQLQYLIRTALDCPVPCRTASDFGLASLSEPAFSRLVQVTLPTLRLTLEDVDDLYPCLPMQEGLLLATLKDPAAYMVQSTYDLLGPLDTKRLQVAWATTTQQHPILRTRFLLGLVDTQHANMQLVTKLAETHWSVSNWSGRDLEQAEAEYMRKEREEGFDLSQVPVRVGLFYVAPNRHRLITSIHHAVLDGWSSGMFMHALLRNYAGRVLPPAGQLKDLVAHVQGCDTHEAERFWAAQLEGVEAPSLLIDPYCVPDPTVRPSDVAYHETLMRTVDIGNAIVDFAQAHGVTVSTFLRAAVSLLLHRYTGSANPVFGTVVSGRNVPVPLAESIIGPCINTLPCRARIDRASTVDGLLQALHRDSTAAYDFEHCRLTDIHRWSGVSQEQPLFNVLFVYQNYPEEQTDSELPIQLEPRDGRDPTDVPLTLISTHSDGQLLIKASAKSHSFSPGFVGRLLDHLVAVIRALVTMPPSDPISAVDMLSSDDKRQLTRTWAQNPVDLPVCSYAHEGFLSIVQSDPSRVALRDGAHECTYGHLHWLSSRLAHRLQQSGRCGADQIVGIMAGNSVELIVGQLAIWMTGSAFVVISPDYPAERQRFILEDAACAAIIGTSATLGDIPDTVPIPQVVINLESLRSSDPTADTQEVTVTPTSLAYIIYTSGTTGTPKGVMHEHRAVAQYIQGFLGAIRITADDVTPTLLTPTFDIATSEIWLTLSVGGCLLITQDDHKVALQQATRAAITPSLLSVFEPRDFPHLLSVILGGEPCSQALADRWSSAVRLFNWYGPTEIAHGTHLIELKPGEPVSIGRPQPNAVGLILDGHLHPVPVGVTGELYLGGLGIARCYLKRPDLTADKFITWPTTGERIYRSGDLARWLPDGRVECLGRIDNQVKVRGFRVELGEVEAALESHPAVTQSCVVVQDTHLVGYVCPPFTGDSQPILDRIRARLAHYMVPSALMGLTEFPRTRVGKIDRKALPRYDFAVPSHFITDLATLSPAESRLVQAVADCLHLSPSTVNLDTTFFQIGGNSLTGIQLASHCQHQGLQLTVSDFDRQSTLRQLAQRAAQVTESPAQTMLFPERSDATMYLTPAQKQFFKHDLANPQVSAIPAMFEVRRPSSEDTWQEAVAQVVLRHPMLRARFSRDPQTKQVSYTIGGTPTEHYRFQYHLAAKTEAMVAILVEAFQRLDFWTGHLSEFHVFDLVGTQYFFHCTHHLVNDYLTSALISEEVEALLLGRPLVPATVPFRVWAAHLHELAQQIDPHTLQLPPNIPSLSTSPPPDAASAGGLDHASILQSEFTAQETRSLLFDACEHHQVSQLELILAGLLLAYSEIFELEVLGLDFITHGRQPLGSEPLDVTRTVGYFAHNIPLAIIASTGLDQAASLQEVQRQLPGLLRDGPQLALVNSLHEFQDPVLREKFNVQPQISFSYLAQLTASSATQESGLFTKRPDLHQALRRVQSVNRSPYAMDITVQHKEGGLQLMIHYRADILPRSKVERFLAKWKKDLLDFRTPRA